MKESNVHTTHTWKPLVERRVHIETNNTYTVYVYFFTDNEQKQKWSKKKAGKKNFHFPTREKSFDRYFSSHCFFSNFASVIGFF